MHDIKNNIVGSAYVKRSLLKCFQGALKKDDAALNKKLQKTILKRGFDAPIYLRNDHDNLILDGHQRLKALNTLAQEGYTLPDDNVPVVFIKAQTEKEAKEKVLQYNAKYSEFDLLELGTFATGLDVDNIEMPELEKIALGTVNEEQQDDVPEMDDVSIIVERGDIFQLGQHRLICGDATNITDVESLMDGQLADEVVTDPPYNTGMTGDSQGRDTLWRGYKQKDEKSRLSHMFNDSFTDEQWDTFLHDTFTNYLQVTKGDCAFYVFIDWRRVHDIKNQLENLMKVKNIIVWDKGVHGLGSDYKFTYELCVVGKKGNPEINNRIGTDYQDIRRVQRQTGRNKDHATAKPVELLEKPIMHGSKQDDIILDLFGGSGSTLIACEKTNRRCYMSELEPKYIQVILKRYHNYVNGSKDICCLSRNLDLSSILNEKGSKEKMT